MLQGPRVLIRYAGGIWWVLRGPVRCDIFERPQSKPPTQDSWAALPAALCSVAQGCPTLCNPMDCSLQAPLSMGFPRQEYCSGLPFPTAWDLPDPGIELISLEFSALASGFFTTAPPGKPM